MKATLHTDGAARHQLAQPTGPAGIGAVLRSETGEVIGEIAKGIGLATNNVAEYTALIEGLQMALARGGHWMSTHTSTLPSSRDIY